MKKRLALFLAVLTVGSALHFDELAKLPFLIDHYSEHKAQHPHDSVFAFLYKHYVVNQKAESDGDKKSDSRLPFKDSTNFNSHFAPFAFIDNQASVIEPTLQSVFLPYCEEEVISQFFDIWQLPKLG